MIFGAASVLNKGLKTGSRRKTKLVSNDESDDMEGL